MRIFDLAGPRVHAVADFGSMGATIYPIVRPSGSVRIARMEIAPGGQIGAHPADVPQLFVVLVGAGWVAGSDGRRVAIHAGQAAYWEPGEVHGSGTVAGMSALVIEADTLDPTTYLATVDDRAIESEG